MITLFCVFIMIVMFIGILRIFGWMLRAAFHLIPFLFEIFLIIAVLSVAWYLLRVIGCIAAIALIAAGCSAVRRKV